MVTTTASPTKRVIRHYRTPSRPTTVGHRGTLAHAARQALANAGRDPGPGSSPTPERGHRPDNASRRTTSPSSTSPVGAKPNRR